MAEDNTLQTNNDLQGVLAKIQSSYTKLPKDAPNVLQQYVSKTIGGITPTSYTNVAKSDIYGEVDGKLIAKYSTFLSYRDNEEHFAQKQQQEGGQWSNGIKKALGQTLTGIVGGTVGTVYGLVEGIKEGSFQATYDNKFMNYLDDLNKEWSYELPNYYTKAEKEAGFTDSLGSTNFWANDVLGGAAFTVSAIGTELLWARLTGGASVAPGLARRGAQISRMFSKAKDLKNINTAKELVKAGVKAYYKDIPNLPKAATIFGGKLGELVNTARFTYTSSAFESGFQTRHYINEMRDSYYSDFYEKNQREPSAQEAQDFEKDLQDSAGSLFAFNMAVVGTSNLATIGRIYDIKSPLALPTKWANSKLFGMGVKKGVDGTMTQLAPSALQKVARVTWGVSRSPLMEGVFEEGMQAAGDNTAKSWVEAGYDPKYASNSLSVSDAFSQGLSKAYGTKEGLKEIGIGALIGLLTGTGVNVMKGRGVLGEFKQGDLTAQGLAANYNYYSPNRLAETMKMSGRVQKATEDAERADHNGDFTGGELAAKSSIISQLNFGYNFDNMSELVDDTKVALNAISLTDIAKTHGITEDEAVGVKEKMISGYEATVKSFKKNRDYSEYLIGKNLKKDGLDSNQAKLLKEAIAYELTLGESAHSFNQDILTRIKEKVGGTFTNTDLTNAIDVDNIISQATNTTQTNFKNSQVKLTRLEQSLRDLEKQRMSLEKVVIGEDVDAAKRRLDKLSQKTVEIQQTTDEKNSLEKELNALLATANSENPFTQKNDVPYVTSTELTTLYENLDKIKKGAGFIRNSNPQEALELQKLVEEYGKSLVATSRYSELATQLADPNLGLRGKRGLIGELSGKKDLKEDVEALLAGLKPAMDKLLSDYKTTATEANIEVQQDIENITNTNEDGKFKIPEKVVVTEEEKPAKPTSVREEIKKLINETPYLLTNVGDSPAIPTEEEVNEFYNLAEKAFDDPTVNDKTIQRNKKYKKGTTTVISNDELARLKELNKLMSDWQLMQGAVNADGISLSDLLLQEVTMQKEVEPATPSAEATEEEISSLASPQLMESEESIANEQIIQTYDNAFTKKTKYGYTFHNINLNTLLNGVADILKVKKKDGTVFEIPISSYLNNKEVGDTYYATINGQEVEFYLDLGAVIRIKKEDDFKAVMSATGMLSLKYAFSKNTGYSLLYKDKKPVKSDYVTGNTGRQYSSQEAYNLNQGDNVYFEVDKNDAYNKELLADKTLTDAQKEQQLKIYIVDEKGSVIGDLKAEERTGKSSEFLALRKAAYTRTKQSKESVVKVPLTTTVNKVYLGVPNFEAEEAEGGVIHKNYDLTDRALEEVVDYGYTDGQGGLVLKGNTNQTRIRKTFIDKLGNKRGVPIILFRKGEYLIAFPVNLVKRPSQKGEQINEMFTSNANPVKIATGINQLLLTNNLNPKDYNIQYSSSENNTLFKDGGEVTDNVKRAIDVLNSIEEYVDVTTWDKDHNKEQLKTEITTPLNLEDETITSPKVVIDLPNLVEIAENVYDRFQALGEKSLTEEDVIEFANKAIQDVQDVKDDLAKQEGYNSYDEAISDVEQAIDNTKTEIENYTIALINKKNSPNTFSQIEGDKYLTDKGEAYIVKVNKGILNTPNAEYIVFYGSGNSAYRTLKSAENKKFNGSIDFTSYISAVRKIEEKLSGTSSVDIITEGEFVKGNQKTIGKADVRNIYNNLQDSKKYLSKTEATKAKLLNTAEMNTKLSPEDYTITQTKKVQGKVKEITKASNAKQKQAEEEKNKKCN